jgi:hypothetical protein
MDDRNPYAPSKASLTQSGAPDGQVSSGVTAWRYRQMLIMVRDSELPERCVKCNEPAHAPTKARKVYWHHPGVYLLILINIIIYAIVGAFVRKRAIVAPGMCLVHKKRRRLWITAAWCTIGLGFVLTFVDSTQGAALGIGIVLILVAILMGIIMSRIVYAHKIEPNRVWLKGCGSEFLDSLPELPQGER